MIIFRSVFSEMILPFFMTMVVMSSLLMMEKIYRLVNLVVGQRLNIDEVGLMLVYFTPQIIAITLPLSVVGAVFMTVIRQSMESEVVSMRASGRSLWNYSQAFLAFGLVATMAGLVVSLWLQPLAWENYLQLQVEMVRWRAEQKLVPGEFNYDFGDKVIRVGGRATEDELSDIFISSRTLGPDTPIITASRGKIDVDEEARQVLFRLRDGEIYSPGATPESLRTIEFGTLRYVLDYEPAHSVTVQSIRTTTSLELAGAYTGAVSDPALRDAYAQELQSRLSGPWTCLAFALASLPMAIMDPRSGKRAGYLRAIFLVAAYYIVWAAFQDLVKGGKAPPIGLWLPSLLVAAYGMLRLWQLNTDADSLWKLFRR